MRVERWPNLHCGESLGQKISRLSINAFTYTACLANAIYLRKKFVSWISI